MTFLIFMCMWTNAIDYFRGASVEIWPISEYYVKLKNHQMQCLFMLVLHQLQLFILSLGRQCALMVLSGCDPQFFRQVNHTFFGSDNHEYSIFDMSMLPHHLWLFYSNGLCTTYILGLRLLEEKHFGIQIWDQYFFSLVQNTPDGKAYYTIPIN